MYANYINCCNFFHQFSFSSLHLFIFFLKRKERKQSNYSCDSSGESWTYIHLSNQWQLKIDLKHRKGKINVHFISSHWSFSKWTKKRKLRMLVTHKAGNSEKDYRNASSYSRGNESAVFKHTEKPCSNIYVYTRKYAQKIIFKKRSWIWKRARIQRKRKMI